MEFLPLDDLRRQLEVNLIGHVAVTQAFLPSLRENHGRIVFVSSLAGRFPQPMVGAYCASKHALEAVADVWRVELRPWSIDVSIIEPGAVATPIWNKSDGAATAMIERISPRIYELYGNAMATMRKIAQRADDDGVPPQQVAVAVADALLATKPKTRYVIGRDAKMALLVKRFLSDRMRDRLILRVSGLPRTVEDVRAPRERKEAAELSH
jgi:NAD(P)-dependent dehydrogenase (short-subunit alcohol dehydrogenase family)